MLDRPRQRLSYCADQVRRFDRDRFLCALLAPAERREALCALYAFNLEIAKTRETVREPLLGEIRLQWWRDAIAELYEGRPRAHEVLRALAPLVSGLSREPLERLINARAFDLDDAPPADFEALLAYLEGSAAPLAHLTLELLGDRDEARHRAAHLAALGWGLTGLLRAVATHARAKRQYLPAAWLDEEGVRRGDLFELRSSPGLARLARRLADAAESRLDGARALAGRGSAARVAVHGPAIVAKAYLRRLRRAGFDPLDRRFAVAPPAGRGQIAWQMLTRRI